MFVRPFLALLLLVSCTFANGAGPTETNYDLLYVLDLREKDAKVGLVVENNNGQLRQLSFQADSKRFYDFTTDSGLVQNGDRWVWNIPKEGGSLRWRAAISHDRGDNQLDAYLGKDWALFRGEDAFPAMASRAIRGSRSRARLKLTVPRGWSASTPFEEQNGVYKIQNPQRRFDRPTGWLIAGELGVRIDRVAGTRVSIAAAKNQNVRRQDILALTNWLLPEVRELFPDFSDSLLIVSADDPFWRGGLSGPASLYIHADRPLISENGTSTLAHEVFHVAFGKRAADKDDWIIEGLAEYYGIELLRRSGTTTEKRFQKTLRQLSKWGQQAKTLQTRRASGAVSARAASLFAALDAEIRKATNKTKSLDNVVRALAQEEQAVSLDSLEAATSHVMGRKSKVLAGI